jgi:hypothetical protein
VVKHSSHNPMMKGVSPGEPENDEDDVYSGVGCLQIAQW